MIDKITITVDQQGWWNLNAGDMVYYRSTSVIDVLMEVKGHLDKLGYYPPPAPIRGEPVPFDRLPEAIYRRKRKESEKEHKARLKAEKHLDSIRLGNAPQSPGERQPTLQVD